MPLRLGTLAVMAASLVACGHQGQVVEKGTDRPLEGVVVVKSWRGQVWSVVQTHSDCYSATYSLSDQDGRFSLPTLSRRLNAHADRRTAMDVVYKPGYRVVETNYEDRIVMERQSDSRPARFEQVLASIARMPYDCPYDDVRNLVAPILRPAHAELERLAETQAQLEKTDSILGTIDTFTLDADAAHVNAVRRRAEREEKARSR